MIPQMWNATIIDRVGHRSVMDVRGKHVNYLDAGLSVPSWRPIDCSFTFSGRQAASTRSPWSVGCPEHATGEIAIANRMAWDVKARASLATLAPLTWSISHPDARHVSAVINEGREWQVTYPDAMGDGVDIVCGIWHARAPRLEHIYVIRRMPSGDADTVQLTSLWRLPSDVRWSGQTFNATTDARRGNTIRPAVAWYYDAAGRQITTPIRLEIRPASGGAIEVVKHVPRSLIAVAVAARPGGELRVDATSTFYPNADPETTSVDGLVQQSGANATWETVRDGAGSSAQDTGNDQIWITVQSGFLSNKWGAMSRGLCLFDTSALTASATISEATLSLYPNSLQDTGSWGWSADIYTSEPASNTELAAGDYDSLGTTSQTGAPIAYSSLSTGAYNVFTLNATGIGNISLTGVSKFGVREATYDAANSPPTWSSSKIASMRVSTAEQTGTSQDPKLVVTYTLPIGAPALFHRHYMNQGMRP